MFSVLILAVEQVKRKSRIRTPKAEKAEQVKGKQENAAKGRRRKKPLKAEVKDTSDLNGDAGSPSGEVDPITATIDAVLANASALDTSVVKLKKVRRVKKQHPEGAAVAKPKHDVDKSAEDAEENDDSSTAGTDQGLVGDWVSHAFCRAGMSTAYC